MNRATKELRTMVWKKYFPNQDCGYDIFGNYVCFQTFEIDHIFPASLNGSDCIENLFPLASISNRFKSYHLQGNINGRSFIIKKLWINNDIVGEIYINQVKVS